MFRAGNQLQWVKATFTACGLSVTITNCTFYIVSYGNQTQDWKRAKDSLVLANTTQLSSYVLGCSPPLIWNAPCKDEHQKSKGTLAWSQVFQRHVSWLGEEGAQMMQETWLLVAWQSKLGQQWLPLANQFADWHACHDLHSHHHHPIHMGEPSESMPTERSNQPYNNCPLEK